MEVVSCAVEVDESGLATWQYESRAVEQIAIPGVDEKKFFVVAGTCRAVANDLGDQVIVALGAVEVDVAVFAEVLDLPYLGA